LSLFLILTEHFSCNFFCLITISRRKAVMKRSRKASVKIELEDSKDCDSNADAETQSVKSNAHQVEEYKVQTKKEKLDLSKSPFPDYQRPTPEECTTARKFLSNLHWGSPDATMRKDSTVLETENPGSPGFSVLDSLIATILSQNTTDSNSWPAFQRLKKKFPTWDSARDAPVEQMEECIRSAGLAHTKSLRIHAILNRLASERPKQPLSLEHLRSEPDTAAAMAQLTRFPGVGPKTAACVAMFTLGRPEFPVDTHVLRLALALGWVPRGTGREAAYAHLNRRVPDPLKLDLHVLLVLHGKMYRNDPSMLRRALAEDARPGSTTPAGGGALDEPPVDHKAGKAAKSKARAGKAQARAGGHGGSAEHAETADGDGEDSKPDGSRGGTAATGKRRRASSPPPPPPLETDQKPPPPVAARGGGRRRPAGAGASAECCVKAEPA
jgi:endonuclease III